MKWKQKRNQQIHVLNSYTGSYGALTDRNISKETAKKYGVRRVISPTNDVSQHIYPSINGNEITAN